MGEHANKNPVFNLSFRRYLYGISTAIIPLLVAYGILDNQKSVLWVALITQVLATSTALMNTPGKSKERVKNVDT